MKSFLLLTLAVLFFFPANAIAYDLSGIWVADNLCISGGVLPSDPVPEESSMSISQDGVFFVTEGIYPNPGETCGGIIIGKMISMTCPPHPDGGTGTIFNGELKGPNIIEGINHVPDDGKTCSIVVIRQ